VKELIRKEKEKGELFEAHPIIIVDLPRAQSKAAQNNKIYEVLESIMGSFHSTKRGGEVVSWARGQEPHVIVFANETPDVDRLSGDRLQVDLIDGQHKLVKAKWIHAQIDAFTERMNTLQKEEEAAAISGKPPPRLATRNRGDGASGSGALSPEAKNEVVAELQQLLVQKEGSIVTLRTQEPSLVSKLSDNSLRLLGAKDVEQARNPVANKVVWLSDFLTNLKACLVEGDDCAFPGFEIQNNTTGNTAGIAKGRRFTGEYIKDLELIKDFEL
jgi:hypothetical protein